MALASQLLLLLWALVALALALATWLAAPTAVAAALVGLLPLWLGEVPGSIAAWIPGAEVPAALAEAGARLVPHPPGPRATGPGPPRNWCSSPT